MQNSPPRAEGDVDIQMNEAGTRVIVILPNAWLGVETWSTVTDNFIPSEGTTIKQAPVNRRMSGGVNFSFHSMSRLFDGRLSMLLDIGPVGNLTGEITAREIAKAAIKAGRMPQQ